MDDGFNPGQIVINGTSTDLYQLAEADVLPDTVGLVADTDALDGVVTFSLNGLSDTIGSLEGQATIDLTGGVLTTGGTTPARLSTARFWAPAAWSRRALAASRWQARTPTAA